MTPAYIVISGLFGLVVGSFLNVCIDRLPKKRSLTYPPSHCDACDHPLSIRDLIPLLSFLWLRGRCRYCGARIPWRIFLVELATGSLFAFLFWYYGLSYQLAVTAFYTCVLLVLSVIDLYHKLILNVIVYPMAVIAIVIGAFLPEVGIRSVLLGGAIGFGILLLPALISRSGMGWGDVKMAGLIGLMTGWPGALVGVLCGILLGGITAIFLLITKKKSRKEGIAFGPFLALGCFAALLWGKEIFDWYMGFF